MSETDYPREFALLSQNLRQAHDEIVRLRESKAKLQHDKATMSNDYEIQQKQINWLLKELAMVSEALGLDEDDCQIQSKVMAINKLNAKNAELEAIIQESKEQKPVAWFEKSDQMDAWFLAYSQNTKAETRPLFAAPVMKEKDNG